MSLKAVFFDLDGTLLDTAPNFVIAMNKMLARRDRAPIAEQALRAVVSDGANAMLQLVFGTTPDDAEFPALRQEFLDCYLEDLASVTTAYPGIDSLIGELAARGVAWGIVTNKPATYAEPLMTFFDFASEPSALICPDHVTERKPAPDALLLACEQTGCSPDQAIYVGDHQRDIECGINAGMPTVAVGYGYIHTTDSHTCWNADHTVESANEIWPIVHRYL
ncbi:HAD-IA family hydrolase [Teredinibacter turnerae]|uniref:HAD-IA family hydrolase n=1 Tax=Teredinibacter turnerae TaxID=2426 RepID=UPI000376D9B6|nr:HAD-IA family hydrolase [Teredinibacter turnerae]